MALNLVEGASAVRGMANSMLVVLLVIATGCTGFVTVSPFFKSSLVALNPTYLCIEYCRAFIDVARSFGS